ncbi:hypothetical protein FI667_g10717, partial [Globisporangium splendens]
MKGIETCRRGKADLQKRRVNYRVEKITSFEWYHYLLGSLRAADQHKAPFELLCKTVFSSDFSMENLCACIRASSYVCSGQNRPQEEEAVRDEEAERAAAAARAKAIEDRINKRRRPQSHVDSDGAAPISPLASSGSNLAAPSSANRRRRPAGRHASMDANDDGLGGASSLSATGVTLMGNADVSVRTQMQKALGKYTARECTLLCEVILQQIRENSTLPGVLESDFSPAHIAWDRIAQKMLTLHRLSICPRDAQELWKFLAYAEQPASTRKSKTQERVQEGGGIDEEILPASDDDDYDIPVDVINERHKQNRPSLVGIPAMIELTESDVNEDGCVAAGAAMKETKASGAMETQASVRDPVLQEEKVHSKEMVPASEGEVEETNAADGTGGDVKISVQTVINASSQEPRAVPHDPSSRLRLYPVYELPTGTPEGWQKPLQLKEMLPLTFVAGTFLKRKADSLADSKAVDGGATAATSTTAATVSTPLVGDATGEKPKKKRGRKSTDAKSKATDGTTSEQQKKPKSSKTPIPAGTANANAPTPRAPYVPSSTPPPQASPPRDTFHFFTRMYEENPASVVDALPQATQQPMTSIESSISKDVATLQQLFATASPTIRSKCEQLALDDLDRYNRECVRRRIWEKAMSSQTNSPIPSPANPITQLTTENDASSKSAVVSIPGTTEIPKSTFTLCGASGTDNRALSPAAVSQATPNVQQ